MEIMATARLTAAAARETRWIKLNNAAETPVCPVYASLDFRLARGNGIARKTLLSDFILLKSNTFCLSTVKRYQFLNLVKSQYRYPFNTEFQCRTYFVPSSDSFAKTAHGFPNFSNCIRSTINFILRDCCSNSVSLN